MYSDFSVINIINVIIYTQYFFKTLLTFIQIFIDFKMIKKILRFDGGNSLFFYLYYFPEKL